MMSPWNSWQSGLRAWVTNEIESLPWKMLSPLSLPDAEAAAYEHLERLAPKRFPAEWRVMVTRYREQDGIAIRYEIHSHVPVGHFRIRRIGDQLTELEVKRFFYGNEAGEARLREIMAVFAGRWLEELERYAAALELNSRRGAADDWTPAPEPAPAPAAPQPPDPPARPWEQIPDTHWDRAAVRGLWELKTDGEIAQSLGYSAKTIANRLSELRRHYPHLVPPRDELRKQWRRSRAHPET